MSSEPATLIVAGDEEGRGLQQLKLTGEPPHTPARSRSRTWRAAPLAASPQPALSSSRGVAHARSSVLARLECMARCGAEWGQCRRTKGERAREATPRVENVSVRRGLPSATRPPPAGSRVQVTGQCGRPRSARHRGRARLCPKTRTYVPRHGARRRASATAQNGASWASPPVEARACCQPERVASITNRVSGRARAHMCVCSARLGPRTCARAHVGDPATQCQHMTHASRSAAPPTPRPARRGARASTRATHESARRMDRARPRTRARPTWEGGPPGSARPTARAPSRPGSIPYFPSP